MLSMGNCNIDPTAMPCDGMEFDAAQLLSEMPGGFFVYRADGDERIVYVNNACLRIFGCSTLEQFKELTGFTFPGMVHPDDIDAIERSIHDQIESNAHRMDYVEYRIITYNGSVRRIQDYGHYVQKDSGNFFYVFIDDATDRLKGRMAELEEMNLRLNESIYREHEHRRLLRAALKQANSANIAKTTFLNNMSHDIRTHLNAITGYSQLIADHIGDAQRILDYTEKITLASNQLLDVVVETLEVSHFEAGRVQLFEADCTWPGIISKIENRYGPVVRNAKVNFTIETDNIRHNAIFADEQRIKQLIEQLVDNSIKYTPQGGSVQLRIEELKDKMEGFGRFKITVADTGCGMSPEFTAHMFEPFERENTTTESGVSGTGLGLTIVRHTVNLLAGHIEVDSTPGKGTSICVSFTARLSSPIGEVPEPKNAQPRESSLSVLVVEDNELNREIAVCLLEDAGYKVRCAEDGRKALEVLCEGDAQFDAVLMDIQMPSMNGYDAARAIRAMENPNIATLPIIATTSDAFPEDRKKAIDSGMNGHIAKPLTIERIEEVLLPLIH